MSQKIYDNLCLLLDENKIQYTCLEHAHAGKSEEVTLARNTELQQGAKALVCKLKIKKSVAEFILIVLPADMQANLEKLKDHFHCKNVSLATHEQVMELTDCEIGTVPPFSFNENLTLVVDPSLIERNEKIAFNAGLFTKSIVMNAKDYVALTHPDFVSFSKTI